MAREKFFETLHRQAEMAGMAAGAAAKPKAMMVGTPTTLLGSSIDASKAVYLVPEGVCGFAWVKIKGNTAFGRWMKKVGLARPDYPAGLAISCKAFGQSMERKEAWAHAYAKVLTEAGITAYPQSRMD